jgi:hypothetical protein
MDIDRRISAAIRRVHDHIEARLWGIDATLLAQHQDNLAWLDERARFFRRSIGQLNRHQRRKA